MPELIKINQGAENASWFYYVNCGAKIWIQNPQSVESCKIYFYTIERPLKYLYTYDYSQEQHLSVYNKEKSVLNWVRNISFLKRDIFVCLFHRNAVFIWNQTEMKPILFGGGHSSFLKEKMFKKK